MRIIKLLKKATMFSYQSLSLLPVRAHGRLIGTKLSGCNNRYDSPSIWMICSLHYMYMTVYESRYGLERIVIIWSHLSDLSWNPHGRNVNMPWCLGKSLLKKNSEVVIQRTRFIRGLVKLLRTVVGSSNIGESRWRTCD